MLGWLAIRNRSSVNFRTDQKRKQEPDRNRISQPKEQPNKNPTERKPPITDREYRERTLSARDSKGKKRNLEKKE